MIQWLLGIKASVWLIATALLVTTALGFGLRRYILEKRYAHSIPRMERKFNDCIMQAMTQKEIEFCENKLRRDVK